MRNSAPAVVDKSKISLNEIFIVILIFLGVMGFLFHAQISSGFTILTGDRLDGLIEISLLEHWHNFFLGKSHWNIIGYFYPYADTLGYNDGYFLYGLIHSFFRMLNVDLFLSSDLVNVVLKTIGFTSFYIFCRSRNLLGLTSLASLTGAVIFTLGNALIIQTGHAQLFSIAFSPLLAIFIHRYINLILSGKDPKKAIAYGSFAGILIGAWLITTFYMAWFFILFTITLASVCFVITVVEKWRHPQVNLKIRLGIAEIAIPAIITIISLLPFLLVYLPAAKNTGMHSFEVALNYAPRLAHLINPSSDNFLFGSLSDYLFSNYYPTLNRTGEFVIGFPPIILIVSFFATLYFWKRSRFTMESVAIRGLSIAVFFSLMVMIKFGDHSLWKIVWMIIPGGKGLRVTARYALFIIFPMAVLVSYYISKISAQKTAILTVLLACLLMLEQINTGKNHFLDRPQQLNFFDRVTAPPAECKSFYVSGQRPSEYLKPNKGIDDNRYPHNVDAMLLSEIFALRTLNGYSTFNPPDWDFELGPDSTYLLRVATYVKNHNISVGLCEYDLFASRWRAITDPNLIGLPLMDNQGLTVALIGKPVLSADKTFWHIDVSVTNHSANPLGSGTLYPVNLGIRGLAIDGTLLQQDLLRAPIPELNAGGGSAVINITLPVALLTSAKVDILPVIEGVSWLDALGIQPLAIPLK